MRAFIRTTYPFLSPATGRARPSTRSCLQVDGASVEAALAGVVTPGNHLIGDGGKAIAAFARKAGIPFHAVPAPGKPTPKAPHLHINNVNAYHGRLKQWLNRFNGVATKNLPNYLGWRRALEGWGGQLAQRRHRKRSIPTANAIRAKLCPFECRFPRRTPASGRYPRSWA
jgi:hypothetical protein